MRSLGTRQREAKALVKIGRQPGREQLAGDISELVVRGDAAVTVSRNWQINKAFGCVVLAEHGHLAKLQLTGIGIVLIVKIIAAQRLHGARTGLRRVVGTLPSKYHD